VLEPTGEREGLYLLPPSLHPSSVVDVSYQSMVWYQILSMMQGKFSVDFTSIKLAKGLVAVKGLAKEKAVEDLTGAFCPC
jgi:hypothetical protein